jgi:hypothetical protein
LTARIIFVHAATYTAVRAPSATSSAVIGFMGR